MTRKQDQRSQRLRNPYFESRTNVLNFELKNHPAQARHPFTKEPLFNDGQPVPLFPKQRALAFDGRIIAYISEYGNVGFIVPQERLGEVIVDEAKKFINENFTPVNMVSSVLEAEEPEESADGDFEDEE